MDSTEPRRSVLVFALDVTGGREVVYRVAVYLQELVRRLSDAPGVSSRARIDLVLIDTHSAQQVSLDRLINSASNAAGMAWTSGARLRSLIDQIKVLPFEGGGFHTFLLMTRPLDPGWEGEIAPLQRLVASVTGLCCGPESEPDAARRLSKEPGGTRIVNPLDTIRIQFDSIAGWLIQNFSDKPEPWPDITQVKTVLYPRDPDPPIPDPTPPPQPPITPAKWRVVEPTDRTDATEHLYAAAAAGAPGWALVGASRRGKLHAHEGTYRDDAFALGTQSGWNLIAVADGAGSCRLSRVGARIGTDAAIRGMREAVSRLVPSASIDDLLMRMVVNAGFETAHKSVFTEASNRRITPRDLSSTLLLVAQPPATTDHPCRFACGQIGDGLIMAVAHDGTMHPFGEANKGYFSGETVFLTSLAVGEWESHVTLHPLDSSPEMVLVMTDGIADDLVPYQRQAPTLIKGVESILGGAHLEKALLNLIGYEKRDSSDDRTLVVLYREQDRG